MALTIACRIYTTPVDSTHLKNYGTLTMVVPPELAYGETGYAPQIPPNATMVYELRIADAGKP